MHDDGEEAHSGRQRRLVVLLQSGVQELTVRHFPAPRISDYLRITVGTDGQIDRLLSALSDILGCEPAAA
jgi:histidinol-phosphate/aromatic aminotransferase/cobyric acid decarboxylase-like protein